MRMGPAVDTPMAVTASDAFEIAVGPAPPALECGRSPEGCREPSAPTNTLPRFTPTLWSMSLQPWQVGLHGIADCGMGGQNRQARLIR